MPEELPVFTCKICGTVPGRYVYLHPITGFHHDVLVGPILLNARHETHDVTLEKEEG